MEGSKNKIIRITTVSESMRTLLKGQLLFMSDFYNVVAISSDSKYFDKMLEEQGGIRGIRLEMTREITPFKDLVALYKLVILLRREKPLIVHTHTPKAGVLGMLAAWIAKVPNRIHTVAGLPLLVTTGVKRRVLNLVERITYSCSTRVLPNSYNLKKIIIQEKLAAASKVSVLCNGSSNGIQTSYFNREALQETSFKIKSELCINCDSFVFVFVGRLVKDKGINELVNAFERLYKINQTITLLLVGPYEEKLDPLAPQTLKAIKSHNAIKHVGYQNDVRPYFKAADALVFPSYREGFPNVVMQAGAMELPSIVTDINGCNEIIIDNTNGVIIPPQDADALFSAMKKFIDNPEVASRMAKKSRPLIQSRYEQQDVWNAILEMYKSLE